MKVKWWKRFAPGMSDSLLGGVTLSGGAGDGGAGDAGGAGAAGGATGGNAGGQATGGEAGTGSAGGAGDFDPGLFQAVGLTEDYWDESGKILGKYATVKDLADGYKEATRLAREKAPAAPENYAFDFSKHETLKDVFNADSLKEDSLWQMFEPTFKKLNITQEQAQGLMETNLLWQMQNVPDINAEEKRLGADAKTILADIQTQVPKIAKTQDDINGLEYIGRNADAIRLLHKVLQMTGEQGIPGAGTGVVFNASSKEALQEQAQKIRSEKMFDADPQLQDKYLHLMEQITKLK